MPVNFNPANALTNLLYSGEIFDQRIAMQYLRARYYDPSSGTFNRLDPFAGNMQDPQSLHKYLYVHGDPVQGIDPSGLMNLGSVKISMAIGTTIGGIYGYSVGGWKGMLVGALFGGLAGGLLGSYLAAGAWAMPFGLSLHQLAFWMSTFGGVISPWYFRGSGGRPWGIENASAANKNKKIVIVSGDLGAMRGTLTAEGISEILLYEELRAAGYENTVLLPNPTEDQFVAALKEADVALAIAHGPGDLRGDYYLQTGSKHRLSAMYFGGTLANPGTVDAFVPGSGNSVNVPAQYITATEIREAGGVNNPNLTFIAVGCRVGRTERFSKAINAGEFVGYTGDLNAPGARPVFQYLADMLNGDTAGAWAALSQHGDEYVRY